MFTGLIQQIGTVVSTEGCDAGVRFVIDDGRWAHAAAPGESIAVNGCCLTVAQRRDAHLVFDVIPQTLSRTTLRHLESGDRVNLEYAATPTTLLGGHLVQGHVDGVGAAMRIDSAAAGEVRLSIEVAEELREYLTPRGSVAVDGVSLTIAGLSDSRFEVALIPATLAQTTLAQIGSTPTPVNIETDCLVKAVVHWLSRRQNANE